MTACTSCHTEMPDDHRYCGRCGSKLSPETLNDVSLRVAALESTLEKGTRAGSVEQRFLEVETTEKIVARLVKWAKMFGFFAAAPILLALVGFTLYVGKGLKDLNDLAGSVRGSIAPVIEKARFDANEAKAIATDAVKSAAAMKSDVASAKGSLSELGKAIADRNQDVQTLNSQIRSSQSQLSALQTNVAQSASKVERIAEQVQKANTEKNEASVRDAYPIFGNRVAGWRDGWIDPAKKKPQEVYVALVVQQFASPQSLTAQKIGQAMTALENDNFRVFLGGVQLNATSGRTSQGLFNMGSCDSAGVSGSPPCVVYFRQAMRGVALKIGDVIKSAQTVPPDRVAYSDPSKLPLLGQELLQKSALDVIVVLSEK